MPNYVLVNVNDDMLMFADPNTKEKLTAFLSFKSNQPPNLRLEIGKTLEEIFAQVHDAGGTLN